MKIFVLGITGYIGGSVAEALRARGHIVVGTARKDNDIAKLKDRGLQATLATLDDVATLERLARDADVVVNAADADHRPSVEALLRSATRLVHTSGSSIVSTDARGELAPDIYTEQTLPTPTPEKAARVAIDRLVLDAGGTVICPTLIYGEGAGLHRESIQVPIMTKTARETGNVHYIGHGKNVWSNVHIRDLVDLYLLALDRPGFYFAENGEASLLEIALAIGRRHALPVKSIDIATAGALWGDGMARFGLGSNSRVRAIAARAIGWQPRGPGLLDSITAA